MKTLKQKTIYDMQIILKWKKPLFRNTNMAAVEHHANHAKTKEKANQKSKTKIMNTNVDQPQQECSLLRPHVI